MRAESDKHRIEAFMVALGQRVRGPGQIFLTGGATAVLHGWRAMTIDVDLKPAPEPASFFEAIALLKDELDLNVELASKPDQFIPRRPRLARAQPLHPTPRPPGLLPLRPLRPGVIQAATPTRPRPARRASFATTRPDRPRTPAHFVCSDPAPTHPLSRDRSCHLPPYRHGILRRSNAFVELMKTRLTLDKFPGGVLVQRGISDLRSNRLTVASCLVKIAHNRLSKAGLLSPKAEVGLHDPPSLEPELQLYRLLRAEGGDAYSRYNALLRELISFGQAFEKMGTAPRAGEPSASAGLTAA